MENKKLLLFVGVGACLGLVLIGCFYLGAYFSCSRGNGELLNWACVNVEDKGVCNIGNQLYEVPQEEQLDLNLTFEGLYKELNEDGSLSEEVYTRNKEGGFSKVNVI